MAQNVIKNLEQKGVDIQATIQMLNKALADEYLAANQYLAPVGLAVGKLRPEVEAEFQKHYEEKIKPILKDVSRDCTNFAEKQEEYFYSDEYAKET